MNFLIRGWTGGSGGGGQFTATNCRWTNKRGELFGNNPA